MCQQKKIKLVAVVMAMSVLFTPLFSILEIKQTVNVVQAEEATISAAFFGAVLAMMGITAYMQGNMSSTFSIPETDLLALKDQFAQTLEADAAKKSAWMAAQTDYLAGGIAKTMGAVELAKIGVNDIYNQFLDYLKNINNANISIPSETISKTFGNVVITNQINNSTEYNKLKPGIPFIYNTTTEYLERPKIDMNTIGCIFNLNIMIYSSSIIRIDIYEDSVRTYTVAYLNTDNLKYLNNDAKLYIKSCLASIGLMGFLDEYLTTIYSGNVIYNDTGDIINKTDENISLLPTIPWIDTTVPVGTIVTPAIAAPYAGTVPIDVPITAPIDPPIEEPETPSYPDVLSATLAILAALTPISAILDNIDLGIGDLDDVIDAGNTAIADGIDDIINSITGSVTDIGTIVEPITSTLDKIFDPPSKDIDWDKLKNIEIFNKFPFSIPSDLYFLMSMLASNPVAPNINIDLDLSFIGAGVQRYTYDLSQFDNFAQVLRSVELLAFVFFLLYSTKNLIWK